jgi:hypothetical protein
VCDYGPFASPLPCTRGILRKAHWQHLVGEEHTNQDSHGGDQQPDGQVSQPSGAFRRTARGEGAGRDEAEPSHGVQRVAVDDRGDGRDEPQRRGDPHEEPVALCAGSSRSAHILGG